MAALRKRRLSGVRATGGLHLGNYLGALKQWVQGQYETDNFFFIADLHGLTDISERHDSSDFRQSRLNLAATFFACGIDPQSSTLFLQSDVVQHCEMMWYVNAVAKKSELERMTQWKEKKSTGHSASAAMFNYPTLMAADILLYDPDEVPVGDDQRQHVEIARDWAGRLNAYLGDVVRLPKAVVPQEGARIMDLTDASSKMSKSARKDGTVYLDDSDDAIVKKIRRAVTDSVGEVAYETSRPEVANLVDLYATLTGQTHGDVEVEFAGRGYGDFKSALADATVATISPIRDKTAGLRADPAELQRQLSLGTDRAATVAEATCRRVRDAFGLGGVIASPPR